MRLVLAGNGPGRDFLPSLPGSAWAAPASSRACHLRWTRSACPDLAPWPPAMFPGVVAAVWLSQWAAVSAGLLGHGMTDACVACCVTIAVLAVLPFPLTFREKK